MEPETEEKKVPCPNCGKKMGKKNKFCPHCGQRNNKGKVSMYDLFGRFFQNLTHLNGKVVKGMLHLLIPGYVSTEYFNGRMKRYPNPVQFFFVVMFFFLLLLNYFLSDKQLQAFDGFSFNQVEQSPDGSVRNDFFETLQRRATAIELRQALEQLPPNLHRPLVRQALDSMLVEAGYASPVATADSVMINLVSSQIDSLKTVVEKIDSLGSPAEQAVVEATLDSLHNIIQEATPNELLVNDTITIGFVNHDYRLAITDLVKASPEAIIQKYKVEDFWERLLLRQGIKSIREPQVLMKYYIGSLTWTLLALIAFMSVVLKLLYLRRHRYYVEHFIFLLHQHSSVFLLLVFFMFGSIWFELGALWSAVVVFIGLLNYFAMLRFYGQGWFKTLLKWILFNMAYLLAFVVFLALGIIVSIALF